MIPLPDEIKPDVLVAVDGSVCFKVQAKVCKDVWKKTHSGWRLVQECFLGEVTVCMDRRDWG